MKIDPFQKKKLRALGAMHAALHENTIGLSRGLSARRAEALPVAQLDLIKAQRQLEVAEAYANRNERYAGGDEIKVIRERAADAETLVADLKAEIEQLETHREAASADSNRSGKVFEKLLKFADA